MKCKKFPPFESLRQFIQMVKKNQINYRFHESCQNRTKTMMKLTGKMDWPEKISYEYLLLLDWTRDTAFVFCEDFLQKSLAYENCQLIPDFDVHSYVRDCREDLFFSNNPTVTIIHLNRLKTECREVLFRMNRNNEEKVMNEFSKFSSLVWALIFVHFYPDDSRVQRHSIRVTKFALLSWDRRVREL